MNSSHQFGGSWTDKKVGFLAQYLKAYQTALKNQPFDTIYVDAFAGTGYRSVVQEQQSSSVPMELDGASIYSEETAEFQKGSAVVALETERPFSKYVFIDKKADHIQELQKLQQQFPDLANRMIFQRGEANAELKGWCKGVKRNERAVVFLDPYGMSVEWSTIEALASTKKVDLWILFPIGMGVNRMLLRKGPPDGSWAQRISKVLGVAEDAWKAAFYRPVPQTLNMFEEQTSDKTEKIADVRSIGEFFLERLRTVFPTNGVATNPYLVRNSKNTPMYLLCFAAANPAGASVAVRIASHILKSP